MSNTSSAPSKYYNALQVQADLSRWIPTTLYTMSKALLIEFLAKKNIFTYPIFCTLLTTQAMVSMVNLTIELHEISSENQRSNFHPRNVRFVLAALATAIGLRILRTSNLGFPNANLFNAGFIVATLVSYVIQNSLKTILEKHVFKLSQINNMAVYNDYKFCDEGFGTVKFNLIPKMIFLFNCTVQLAAMYVLTQKGVINSPKLFAALSAGTIVSLGFSAYDSCVTYQDEWRMKFTQKRNLAMMMAAHAALIAFGVYTGRQYL